MKAWQGLIDKPPAMALPSQRKHSIIPRHCCVCIVLPICISSSSHRPLLPLINSTGADLGILGGGGGVNIPQIIWHLENILHNIIT